MYEYYRQVMMPNRIEIAYEYIKSFINKGIDRSELISHLQIEQDTIAKGCK